MFVWCVFTVIFAARQNPYAVNAIPMDDEKLRAFLTKYHQQNPLKITVVGADERKWYPGKKPQSTYEENDAHDKDWISMEAVPWSVAKISKWHPNSAGTTSKPIYNRYPSPSPSASTNYFYQHDNCGASKMPVRNSNGATGNDLIITDGLPANFPHYHHYHHRQSGTMENRRSTLQLSANNADAENHPFSGNGEWVLLSTTKGFKPRTAKSDGRQTMKVHRALKLTVLPPLTGVNMTTSHGGLIQVGQEGEGDTVDDDVVRQKRRMWQRVQTVLPASEMAKNSRRRRRQIIGSV